MKQHKWMTLGLSMALLLTMAACAQQETEETASPSPEPTASPAEEAAESPADTAGGEETATLTISASFQDAAGAALAGATVRFTVGDTQAEYLTDENGALTVASLPAEGTVEVAVLDELDDAETASAVLEFSEGSVTDVTDQADGTAAVTLLSGTDEIALSFVQQDDGTLACALELSEEADG